MTSRSTHSAPLMLPALRLLPSLALALGLGTALSLPPAALLAQGVTTIARAPQDDPALLVADDLQITPDRRLIASGNVEALYEGRRLRARQIIYDHETETLTIEGPITLQDGEYTTVLADQARLDRDLQNGILTGARIIMDDQLQLAAVQANQVEGRYTQLYKAAVTSCRTCNTDEAPLWQFRARRVIHDKEERQIYLDGAQFRVFDVPVMYLPRLRLPDPTLERATGFLIPSIESSTQRGTGVKVPYFFKLGDHRDLTLTPYIATKTTTLEWRYRQAFTTGQIEFEGAFSNDDFGTERSNRHYLFGQGKFELPRDFELNFDIELVNDESYLLDYDYSDKDRLDSEISIHRARRDEWVSAALTHFRSLRTNEENTTLPTIAGNLDYERRIFPTRLGGELRFSGGLHSHYRSSDSILDGPDYDIWADGRDVTRLTGSADWLRSWTLFGGIRSTVQTGLALDSTHVNDAGTTSASSDTQLTPSASVALRWPLAKTTRGGVTHVIEPVAQFGWVGGSNPDLPNDESTRVEFDEGNLLSMSRFPETDRRERGFIGAYGLSWSRLNPKGLETRLSFGQVWREKDLIERDGSATFSASSGQRGSTSDMLVAAHVATQNGLSLTARGLFDSGFDTTKAEVRTAWNNAKTGLSASYIWLGSDLAEDRPNTISEWAFDASYRMSRHWTGHAEWRYDVASDESVEGGLGVTYTNECVDITLKASRRFTSSTILTPSTDFSLTVGLRGFATRTSDANYARTCRK